MIQVTINGIDRSDKIRFGSLRIRDRINDAVDVCNFTIEEYGSQTFRPLVNQEVIVTVDGSRAYGGVIVETEQSLEGNACIIHNVQCKDWTQHLNRKIVTERYQDMTVQEIVLDLIDRYAATFGFTGTNVQGGAFNVASISFGEITLAECFSKLARLTGYSWYVDYFKDVHFFAKNDEPAPFNLAPNSGNFQYTSLVVADDFSQIRNRVKIRGGEARAEPRTKKWAGNGETDTFATDHKFAELPTVEVDGVEKTVGVDYLNQDEDYEVMWNFQQKYIRFTAGNIPDAPLSGETNIDITGVPLQPLVVQKQNNASIIAYGVYEFVKYNDSLKTREEALQFAEAELEIYAGSVRSGSFRTYNAGLKSGQTININIPARGIDEDFLIQGVEFQQIGIEEYAWTVEIATLKTIGMLDILQKLLVRETISEGQDETLLNFFPLEDGFQFGDELGDFTITTYRDYVWEQGDPGSDSYPNPIVWNKFSWD